jgi:hypothetical protein
LVFRKHKHADGREIDMDPVITSPDILPIPGPAWLLLFLNIFTFILHVVFMNCLFGGTIIALFCRLKGKTDENYAILSKKIYNFMPVVIALTVNLGIPPLLFVQALYGHLLYSSSILMAYSWWSVVPLIIFAYYMTYILKFKWDKISKSRKFMTLAVPVIFSTIAFFFVNNMTLMLRPEIWFEHYFKNPATGTLNWSDAQIYPRYLHMLFGAVSVAGVWIMVIGARRRTGDTEWSNWAVKFGSKVFFYPTLVNIAVGVWFLVAHRKPVLMTFMGGNMTATVVFLLSLIIAAEAILLLYRAGQAADGRRQTYTGAAHLFVVVVLMIINRHQLRTTYLSDYFKLEQLETAPQWPVFAVFTITLIFAFAVLAWMVKVTFSMKKAEA